MYCESPERKRAFWSENAIVNGIEPDAKNADIGQTYGLCKRVEAVGNVRNLTKLDMKLNDALPKIDVDPESYIVTADGEILQCEPVEEMVAKGRTSSQASSKNVGDEKVNVARHENYFRRINSLFGNMTNKSGEESLAKTNVKDDAWKKHCMAGAMLMLAAIDNKTSNGGGKKMFQQRNGLTYVDLCILGLHHGVAKVLCGTAYDILTVTQTNSCKTLFAFE
ncbi:hypothetical protein KSP40_PGU001604 [Platanthera guangdongensis]|uniref:Urease domain-containing protein n=1 Tax=Platanthera guangdongensis TaxID=2320717 RepID=A0ABR2LCQ8_9ASPA